MTQSKSLPDDNSVVASDGDTFQLERELGHGGMGVVYLARQVTLNRTVALKMIRHEHTDSATFVHRLRKEAKGAALLDHKNIMKVFSMGISTENQPFLVMEYIEGQTLQNILTSGPLPLPQFYDVFEQLLSALVAAHKAGIVHRDIKPSNVMVTTSGTIKLTDFGIAKITGLNTQAGAIIGSPDYMSPEQCKGATVDERSDLYSLGCMMFECLTGHSPFSGEVPMQVMHQHIYQAPPELPRSVETALQELVFRALAKEPANRHPNAATMLEHLRQCRQGKVSGRLRGPLRVRLAPTSSKLQYIALAAVVGTAGCIIFLKTSPQPKPAPQARVQREYASPHSARSETSRLFDAAARADNNPELQEKLRKEGRVVAAEAIRLAKRDRAIRDLYQSYDMLLKSYPDGEAVVTPPLEVDQLQTLKELAGESSDEYAWALIETGHRRSVRSPQSAQGIMDIKAGLALAAKINQQTVPSNLEATGYSLLSARYYDLKKFAEAQATNEEILGRLSRSGGGQALAAQMFTANLGNVFLAEGKPQEAVKLMLASANGYRNLAQTAPRSRDLYIVAANRFLTAAQIYYNHLHDVEAARQACHETRECLTYAPSDQRVEERVDTANGLLMLENALLKR